MRFEEFEYLYYVLFSILALILILRLVKKQSNFLSSFQNNHFVSNISKNFNKLNWNVRPYLYGVGLVLGIIGLANPQMGFHSEKVVKSNTDIYIALDISTSMKAVDIAPDRLSKAKLYAAELISSLKGNNIGLIFFAGEAYLQMPLTSDHAAAIMMVNSADTEMAGLQGTDIGSVADLIKRANQQQGRSSNYLILITDGEDHEQKGIEAIAGLSETDLKTFVVAAGTEQGGYINLGNDYKKDPSTGAPILTKINLGYINEIAKAGKAKAYSMEDPSSIEKISDEVISKGKLKSTNKTINEYNSYFQICALITFFLFLLELILSKLNYFQNNRKKLGVKTLTFILILTSSLGNAQDNKTLNKGVQSYQKKNYIQAEEYFNKSKTKDKSGKSSYNLGNSQYKQEKYEDAIKSYEETENSSNQKLKSASKFNKGNARIKMQKYEEGIKDFKDALKQDPLDREAINNLLKAKMDLKKQQQKDQQKKNQNQQNQNNQDQEQNNNQSEKDNKDQKDNKNNNQPQQPQQSQTTHKDLSKNQALQMIEREEEKVQKKLKRNPNKETSPLKDW
jgi:hypothetical protein